MAARVLDAQHRQRDQLDETKTDRTVPMYCLSCIASIRSTSVVIIEMNPGRVMDVDVGVFFQATVDPA